ncbi:MAG: VWA domain-containing protein [Deltaproteobacteria bacterium]|nr:MAG: VWA domain-containing protein [Deltaproteobacteria bacterium]
MTRRLLAPVLLVAGVVAAYVLGSRVPPATWVPPPWLGDLLDLGDGDAIHWVRPAAIWALPLALAPYLVVIARRTLLDARGLQVAIQVLLRAAVLAALGTAAAEPSRQRPTTGRTVVAAVDLSSSMGNGGRVAATDLVRSLVEAAARANAEADDPADGIVLRLVGYAAAARALSPPEDPVELPSLPDADLGSDHAGALRLARALLDADKDPRIVLVTDGRASEAERDDLERALADLRARGIDVFVRLVAPDEVDDVAVLSVEMPIAPRVGETVPATVRVWSSRPGTARLRIERDGAPNPLEPERPMALRSGLSEVAVPVRIGRPGPGRVRVAVEPAGEAPVANGPTANDAAETVYFARRRPRILYAGRDATAALPRALRADALDVEVRAPNALPTDAAAFAEYDAVVLSDVAAASLGAARREALATFVETFGGGLVMIGGEHTFGPGGFGGTSIDRVLPVRFEGSRERRQPTLALILVIDKSGSMSSDDKLDLVKEAARATARTLDPSDEIGVIAFDSQPHVLVRLQPASNRIRITHDIRRLSAGGGTNAVPALREAYLQLAGSRALVKHVILLSDGESPERGAAAVLADMRDADITVSTVGVGAGAGKDFLARMARGGGGRFYYSQDATDVPRIFSHEAREVTRNAIEERAFVPRVVKAAEVLRGIDFQTAPPLLGLVPVAPKARAEVLLSTQDGRPLLVRGRFGLGRTYVFASDAMPRWAVRWIGWSGFPKFWSHVVRDAMRRRDDPAGGATMRIDWAGKGRVRAVVDVEGTAAGFANQLTGTVVRADDPEADPAPLALIAPGRYEAVLQVPATGALLLRARLFDPDQGTDRPWAEALARRVVPYASEFDPRRARARDVERLASASADGRVDGPVEVAVTAPPDPGARTRREPLWPHVVAFVLLPLFLVDLAARRLVVPPRRQGLS